MELLPPDWIDAWNLTPAGELAVYPYPAFLIIAIVLIILIIIIAVAWFSEDRFSRVKLMMDRPVADNADIVVMDEAMRDLNNAGWVLTSLGLDKAGFTRDGLTLLGEFANGELVLSGTGLAEAEVDLDTT